MKKGLMFFFPFRMIFKHFSLFDYRTLYVWTSIIQNLFSIYSARTIHTNLSHRGLRGCRHHAANSVNRNHLIRRNRREKKKIQRRPAKTVGKMGSRNTRPTQGREGLARHIRDGRGRGQSLRRSGPQVPRKQSETQFPRKRQTSPTATESSTNPFLHFQFSGDSFDGRPSAAAPAAGGVLPSAAGLLGVLPVAAEQRRFSTQ